MKHAQTHNLLSLVSAASSQLPTNYKLYKAFPPALASPTKPQLGHPPICIYGSTAICRLFASAVVRQLAIGQYQLDITNYMAFPPDLAPPSTLLFADLQLFASCSSQQNTMPTRPYTYQLEGFPICLGPTNQTISLHPT